MKTKKSRISILFHLGHPAHFHLFKNVIKKIKDEGHFVHILIKNKDVLSGLLRGAGLNYYNILKEGKSTGKLGMVKDLIKRGKRIVQYCNQTRPDVLVGTSVDIPYVGKLLGIPSVNVNEDDAKVVPLYAWLSYPFSTKIISPDCCDNGRWQRNTITYSGYHELAYLHPDHFVPEKEVAAKYLSTEDDYVVLRFAGLDAHHDHGVRGINNNLALSLVDKLVRYKKVFITSERELLPELEKHRVSIDPADLHHILYYASFIVGDSQTMSAEAAVMGTPYIRFNDFVGRIGYLKELEEKYGLGYGIKPDNEKELLTTALSLAKRQNLKEDFKHRKEILLSEKINVADYLYNEILNTVNVYKS